MTTLIIQDNDTTSVNDHYYDYMTTTNNTSDNDY